MIFTAPYRVFTPSPNTQASNLVVSELADTQLKINGTRGNGVGVILVGKLTSSSTSYPRDTQTYTANAAFGSGTDLGNGNYVLYKGTSLSEILIIGLTQNTGYTFYAYEYNALGNGYEQYNLNTATNNPVTTTTLVTPTAPSTQSTNLTFLGLETIDLARGDGLRVLILKNEAGAINGSFLPVDGTTYTVGQALGGGNVVVADGTGTRFAVGGGLLPYNTNVAFRAFEYNIANGEELYLTTTATGNPLVHLTQTEQVWYSPKWAISQSRRDTEHPETTSYMASKNYTGSYFELGSRRLMYVIADNQNDVPSHSDWDQIFLRVQDVTDDPLDANSWSWHAVDGGGDPVPVLAINYLEETTIRQNITSVTNNGGVARITFTGSNGLVSIGKTIRITGTTNYNGDHVLSAFSNTGGQFWIECTGLAYVSSQTGVAVQVEGSIQNWLGTPVVNGSGTRIAYRSVNVGNNGTKYSMGKTTLSADGETLTRQAPFTKRQDGSHNYYQWCQAFYDSDIDEIILMVPNGGFGTEGRWASTDVYRSTDSGLGETFELLATNIFDGTTLDAEGFALNGPPWKESGRYRWLMSDIHIPDYTAGVGDPKPVYPYLSKRVVEVSCDLDFTEVPIRERVIYETPSIAELGIVPGSKRFSFGGNDYIVLNCFRWRVEGATTAFYQVTIDVKLLTNALPSGTQIGRDVYPAGLFRFYLPNVQTEDDNMGGAPAGREILTDTDITNVDSPIQQGLNRVTYSGGYQTVSGLTGYNNQYFAGKVLVKETLILDNQDRGILTKAGVFEISLYQGKFPQVKLTGSNGNVKLYRATELLSVYTAALYDLSSIWFVARLNGGGTDIDLTMGVDYTTITPTKATDQVFTQIADNSNDLVFARVSGMQPYTKEIGSVLFWSGSSAATVDSVIKEAIS